MIEVLFAYLLLGLLFSLVGPLARKIKEEVRYIERKSKFNLITDHEPPSRWKFMFFETILRASAVFIYPILFSFIYYDFIRDKSTVLAEQGNDNNKHLLFFNGMSGGGLVKCQSCNYSEQITCLTHGFGKDLNCSLGFQCQDCGKFYNINNDIAESQQKNCSCGGKLDRKKPVYCPSCKSTDMSYRTEWMT